MQASREPLRAGASGAGSLVPAIGTVIAAVLAAISAIIVLIAQLEARNLENQAADKEREAGANDLPRHHWEEL